MIKTVQDLAQAILKNAAKWRNHNPVPFRTCRCNHCWKTERYIDSWVRLYEAGKL